MRIAGDGLSASVDVDAGEPADAEQVARALAHAGVVFGLDAEACSLLATLLGDPEGRAVALRIATGNAAVVGSDGYFSPAFEPGIRPGHIDDDGKMDFRDRELLKSVRAHAPLGVLRSAVQGVPGTRVDGSALAVPPVREAAVELGPGVQRLPDGQLAAAVDGVILYVPGKQLDVVRAHKHRGDVDLRSGHLDMAGSLSVSGDVLRLFHVRATGDVEIGGSILGGSAHAGGSLAVKGLVQGGSDGDVSAGGDVQARGAERARIRSGGLLKLETSVHCALEAKVIEVGLLRGGSAHAERFVVAREAGLAQHGETAIRAGIPLTSAPEDVRAAVASARDARALQRARGGRDEGRGSKEGRGRPSLQRDALQRILASREQRDALERAAHVVVRTIAHPGVTIQLGDARVTLDQPVESARFSFDPSSRSIRIERFVP
ncbi:MAG: FapA family protein [Polyangiales bacterium]